MEIVAKCRELERLLNAAGVRVKVDDRVSTRFAAHIRLSPSRLFTVRFFTVHVAGNFACHKLFPLC